MVAINDISNFDQDVFLASGFAAPNLGQPLELAIASYDRSVHNLSGGRFTMEGLAPVHSNLRYLVIGAPVDPSTGVLSDVQNPDTSGDTFVVQKVIVRPAQ